MNLPKSEVQIQDRLVTNDTNFLLSSPVSPDHCMQNVEVGVAPPLIRSTGDVYIVVLPKDGKILIWITNQRNNGTI